MLLQPVNVQIYNCTTDEVIDEYTDLEYFTSDIEYDLSDFVDRIGEALMDSGDYDEATYDELASIRIEAGFFEDEEDEHGWLVSRALINYLDAPYQVSRGVCT